MRPIEYRSCRLLGAGWHGPPLGTQLDLRHKAQPPIPLNGECLDCGRRAVMYVRRNGKLVGYCAWHLTPRLPLNVRRSSFDRLKVTA